MRAQGEKGAGNQWDLFLPLLAVEETKGSKNDEKHEPHRGDREKDMQSPGVFLLWWSVRGQQRVGSKMEKSGGRGHFSLHNGR